MSRRHSRGAALLAAMLTVTLVATLAAGALWQQWRAVEVESAERTRVQAQWILTGALDWARLILREDLRTSGGVDHLAEPWAVPLEEARLSTFLAADPNRNVQADAGADDVFLAGSIVDRQALLNVRTLLAGDAAGARENFTRLFRLLGLPQSELDRLAENLRAAAATEAAGRSTADAPLMPQQPAQLAWLGLSPRTVAALEPYVTLLPADDTRVNLNTAPAAVLYAVGRGIGLADAQRLVAARASTHFASVADAARLLPAGALPETGVDVKSSFFEVRGRLRIGRSVIEQRSLVMRARLAGLEVRTLWREAAPPDPRLQQAASGGR